MVSESASKAEGRVPAPVVAVLITSLLAVLLLVVVGMLFWQSYNDTVEKTQARAASAAQIVSTHIQWLVGASRQTLHQMNLLAGADLANISPDARKAISDLVGGLPGEISGSIVDASGTPLFETVAGEAPLEALTGQPFQALKAGEAWRVSALQFDAKTAKQYFVISNRIERNGQFAGAALLRIPAQLMSEFWTSLDIGPKSTVGLVGTDGWLVARFPPPDKPLDLSKYILFTDYLKKSPFGTYEAVSPADGVARIVGYRTVEDAPLIALSSISTDEAFGQFWTEVKRLIQVLLPMLAALAFAAFWLIRLLRADEVRRQQLTHALEQNQLLFREIHHRVKNNLQAVSSLVQLQPIPAEAKLEMGRRIAAMTAVHEQAYRSDEYAHVALADYLTTLIENMRKSHGDKVRIDAKLKAMTIDRDLALPLGLIVNEVVSNAMKHAFQQGGDGQISVDLDRLDDGRAQLTIKDNGVGFVPSDEQRGMGSRLIRGFAAQLGNDYTYESDNGTVFTLRFATRSGNGAAPA